MRTARLAIVVVQQQAGRVQFVGPTVGLVEQFLPVTNPLILDRHHPLIAPALIVAGKVVSTRVSRKAKLELRRGLLVIEPYWRHKTIQIVLTFLSDNVGSLQSYSALASGLVCSYVIGESAAFQTRSVDRRTGLRQGFRSHAVLSADREGTWALWVLWAVWELREV